MSALCVHCDGDFAFHNVGWGDECPVYKDGMRVGWHPTNRFTPGSEEGEAERQHRLWQEDPEAMAQYAEMLRSEEQVMSENEGFKLFCETFDEQVEAEAMRLFRRLHGSGDAGSANEYHAQNPAVSEGWERLAVESLRVRLALVGILEKPHDSCPMCDAGKLRDSSKNHWPDCQYAQAASLLGDTKDLREMLGGGDE